jgi:hypothetical protein
MQTHCNLLFTSLTVKYFRVNLNELKALFDKMIFTYNQITAIKNPF